MAIGGYFELELNYGQEYHQHAIRLNTGRNAFEYILQAKQYKKVYLPFYTCDVMMEPIQKLNLNVEFYAIDETFLPIFKFEKIKSGEAFVYTNYFGICDKQVVDVAAKCKNLIIDNSQAFYSLPLSGVDTFYSPRKFFGLPDGAYLYTNKLLDKKLEKDISFDRCQHLLGRIDTGAEAHFQTYKENSKSLCNQSIRKISNLTQRLLSSINYNTVADIRRQNFNYLHRELNKKNRLKFEFNNSTVPMTYPLLRENGATLKKKMIEKKIFVATYWPNVLDWAKPSSFEFYLVENTISLPIDHRYGIEDMKTLVQIINYLQ